MMDGHQFPTQSGRGAARKAGAPVPGGMQHSQLPQLPGESFEFFGGSIILQDRGPFEYSFANEAFDLILFSLDCAGEAHIAVNDQPGTRDTLLPGRVHFIPAGTHFHCRYDGNEMQLCGVMVRSDRVKTLAGSMEIAADAASGAFVKNVHTPVTDGLGRRMRDFMLNGEHGGAMVAESMATMAVYEIVSSMPGDQRHDPLAGLNADRTPMRRAIDFIEENLERDITLNDIAAVACKSPFHFARRFKDTMGITPVAYLIERRIDRSKELLRRTDLAISSIASQCGFNSQSHYCRTFRRLTQMTPRDYRRA